MTDLHLEELLVDAMTKLDLAFVAWMRRRREAGRPVTRDEFNTIATRATEADNAGDVDGVLVLVTEVEALDAGGAQ